MCREDVGGNLHTHEILVNALTNWLDQSIIYKLCKANLSLTNTLDFGKYNSVRS